jgi:hypothetical protein
VFAIAAAICGAAFLVSQQQIDVPPVAFDGDHPLSYYLKALR